MAGRQLYSTEVDGGAPVRRRFAIAGRMDRDAYLAFIAERARWLDLSGWVAPAADGAVTLVVAGPEALVGALEMAATLGPLTALVESIEGEDEAGAVAAGFEVR